MVEPKLVCRVDGAKYHEGKDRLKSIRQKHGLKWDKRIGTRNNWFWKGKKEYLRGHPKELDPKKRSTVEHSLESATLEYFVNKGESPTGFKEDFTDWCKSVDGTILSSHQVKSDAKKRFDKDLEKWEMWNKPTRKPGMPESFFKHEMDDYNRKRESRIKELKNEHGIS